MQIRPLAEADLPELLALYRHLHINDDPLPAESKVSEVWGEYMSSPSIKCFGVFVAHELVASATLVVIPNLTRGCKPYGLIENVVTHEAHRNRGYGSSVLRVAQSHAWAVGCYKVMLLTGRKDSNTLRFYQSAGFSSD
ncbi:GNAT family N-acetyltransferase, partial [Niveibacterium umoris]|uniref:GNAT family N-acetyltransferase n=1 Tax=Niveibacterium umoris TaxID=1193620 RepID=UPI0030B8557F